MPKTTLYYNNYQVDMELPEQEHAKLIKKWGDISNRGGNITVTTKYGTEYNIDLTLVQLVKTEK